jgi:23S rRNA (adenine1618-N6)-methyltransferase
MTKAKKKHISVKPKMHARNRHQGRYDFDKLITRHPDLKTFVRPNIHGDESIDFFDPKAVLHLNTALLKFHYNLDFWEIPEGYLCPPVPGRADYIHHVSDLLGSDNFGKAPTGQKIKCFDVGFGASCIYPIIGSQEYNWSFIGSDIDLVAFDSATKIIESNSILQGKIELRLQTNPNDIFYGSTKPGETYDLSICNPPFHASEKEAFETSRKKLAKLTGRPVEKPILNFGGSSNELWCQGGEIKFVREMIRESKRFGESIFWFTTLVAKQTHLKGAYESLKRVGAAEVKTIPMGQGNKASRILAWTYFNEDQKKEWRSNLTSKK